MLMLIYLMTELLALFICVHAVHGKRLKIDIPTVVTYVSMIAIMFLSNTFEWHNAVVIITYVLLYLFCVFRFKQRPASAFVGVVLAMILIVVIQFCCIIIFAFLPDFDGTLRGFIINIITVLIIVTLSIKVEMNKLKEIICRRHWLMYSIMAFSLVVVLLSMIQIRKDHSVNIGFFAFGIPSIVLIFCLLVYWDKSRNAEKELKTEMDTMLHMKNNYDDLVVRVKENQHGINNHMMAVLSSHYAYKSYDELVEAQQEYCDTIQEENKYNSLILINNYTLGGFLYAKLQEMEEKGIDIEYLILTQVGECVMPYYYIVESLGVLLDNAAEAVLLSEMDRKVSLEVSKRDSHYIFTIRNVFRQVDFEEMERWFYRGETTKGEGHGIGLHRVLTLCEKHGCEITCRNVSLDDKNWIEFNLIIREKKGDA